MRIRHLLLWASAATVVTAAPAYPQDWASSVTQDSALQVLITETLGRNPGVVQRDAALRAARLRVRPAGALPDPMLGARLMDLTLPAQVDAEVSQEIPWPGTLRARTGVARAAEGLARAELEDRRRDVVSALAAAYYRLRYTVTALATLRRQRALLEAAVQLSTTRYATGVAPQSDPLQAKLARDRLRSEEFALEADHAAALAAVNALRGRPAGDSVAAAPLGSDLLRAPLPALPPQDSLVALALAGHPRLAAGRAAVQQASRSIQVERLAGRPDFTLSVRYGYRPVTGGTNLPNFFSTFVGLRIPLWATRKQHRLADAARFDSTAAASIVRGVELALRREVTETAARATAARHRLELLVDGILPAAGGTVESVLRSYQVGRAEFLTLLAVEDAQYRAQLEAAGVATEYQTHLVMLRELTAKETEP
ncbi:MAG: TolC family protein [Gemmatimonadetes bacterium]|nr:TolC family protein [Gemmatimonadota bacterium]